MSTGFNFTIAGVINLDNGQFVKLYPNPVHDKLLISFIIDGSSSLGFELYDFTGKRVRMENNFRSGAIVNLQHLPPGVYFIKLSTKHRALGSIKIMKTE
jgi:hypothetical protein